MLKNDEKVEVEYGWCYKDDDEIPQINISKNPWSLLEEAVIEAVREGREDSILFGPRVPANVEDFLSQGDVSFVISEYKDGEVDILHIHEELLRQVDDSVGENTNNNQAYFKNEKEAKKAIIEIWTDSFINNEISKIYEVILNWVKEHISLDFDHSFYADYPFPITYVQGEWLAVGEVSTNLEVKARIDFEVLENEEDSVIMWDAVLADGRHFRDFSLSGLMSKVETVL